jgi:3',5'-cyclic-AMP phosphodiesterase
VTRPGFPYPRSATQYGQLAPPTHVLAHLSDTHLLAGEARQYDVIDTVARFEAALDRVGRIDPPPQALVLTGDLADVGDPAAYRRLRELVEPLAERIGAQVVW